MAALIVKPMQSVMPATLLLLLGLTAPVTAAETNLVGAHKVAITNLLNHKQAFNGKRVEVVGYYLGSFEHYALYEGETNRDRKRSLWIDPSGEAQGYKQNISGDRYAFRGKVRIIGTFDYRPDLIGVGHMNGWPAQITKLELFEKTE